MAKEIEGLKYITEGVVNFDEKNVPIAVRMYAWVTLSILRSGYHRNFAINSAALCALETADFTSRVFLTDNNLSGIKWINKPHQNATRGLLAPASEKSAYAHFATKNAWLVDYLRIMKLPPAYPYKTITIKEFAVALKKNKYYGAPEAQYEKLLWAKHRKWSQAGWAYLRAKDKAAGNMKPTQQQADEAYANRDKVEDAMKDNSKEASTDPGNWAQRNWKMIFWGVVGVYVAKKVL